jgi:hypothetical protein
MSLPNSRYGPEDRHLFEDVAAQVYRDAVDYGSLAGEDPQLAEGGKYSPAVELLLDLGLLRWDEEAFRYYPVDPAMVQSQVVVRSAGTRPCCSPSPRAGRKRSATSATPTVPHRGVGQPDHRDPWTQQHRQVPDFRHR